MTDAVDVANLARVMETELERCGTAERATGEKRYLKSDMEFLGTTLADVRRVAPQTAADRDLDRDGAVRLAGSRRAHIGRPVSRCARPSSTSIPLAPSG